MNTKEFLDNVCKEIKYKPANKTISDELESHIEEIKEENICKGMSVEEAEKSAVKQMGDAKKIGKKLNKIHKPKLDFITLILAGIIIILGGGYYKLLYPTTKYMSLNGFINGRVEYIIILFTLLLSVFLYFWDYRKMKKYSNAFYIIATILNIIAYFRGFRANGNLIYGLWPFVSISPAVITVPLYIIVFAGFMSDINKEEKIKIINQNNHEINPNIIKIAILSIISVIFSLMINFVSGFLVSSVYIIMTIKEILKNKNIKYKISFIIISIVSFVMLAEMICIIPLKSHMEEDKIEPTSAYWVGVETKEEKAINFVRSEIFKSAKLIGKADLQNEYIENEYGYIGDISKYFDIKDNFALLSIVSNYGWIAGFILIGLLLAFNVKLIINAVKMKNKYGKMLGTGIACLYMLQTVCNLLMNFGIIETAEFNLQFISVGNVEWLVNILCVSLTLSVYRRKNINFEEPKKLNIVSKIENFIFEEC